MKTKFDNIKTLSHKNILEGIRHCSENSDDLYKSSLILKRNKKYGVANSILILSIDELMKCIALFTLLISEPSKRELLREIFESKDLHGRKHEYALFINEYIKLLNRKKLKNLELNYNSPVEVSRALIESIDLSRFTINIEIQIQTLNNWFAQANERKNAGLYVAYNYKWFTPSRINESIFLDSIKETKFLRKNLKPSENMLISINESEIDAFIQTQKLFLNQYALEHGF